MPVQAQCLAEDNASIRGAAAAAAAAVEDEEEEDEELITRRRHVTGDSGIEVCVCQLDVDEGSGLDEEESDEEQRMCKVSGRDCCSGHQQPLRQKERGSELAGPTATSTASSSSGDHMV